MSHYVAEIVIPPTCDIEGSIRQVMDSLANEDEEYQRWEWADYYVLGGRWSGHKLRAKIGEEPMNAFFAELTAREVTVSGLVFGKQTLKPASQIPMVDALWREWFPNTTEQCPLFDHAPNCDDAWKVADIPAELICERLIVAAPHWNKEKPNEIVAGFMLCAEYWNGVLWQKSDWDGNVLEGIKRARESERPTIEIQDDWLVVTVDYHN